MISVRPAYRLSEIKTFMMPFSCRLHTIKNKLYLVIVLTGLYLFIPLLVILTLLQGHSSIKQLPKIRILYFAKFLPD